MALDILTAEASSIQEGSIDQQVVDRFDEQLEALLVEPETEATFVALAQAASAGQVHEVSAESVRLEVTDRREAVVEGAETMREGWNRAEQRLAKASKELGERAPASRVRNTLLLGVILTVVAFAVLLYFAITVALELLLISLIFTSFFSPWMSVMVKKEELEAELAVSIRRQTRDEAEKRFRSALVDQITVAIREAINRGLVSFSPTFRIFDTRGLRELADSKREVNTTAREELELQMTSLANGSIGLAGPRGSGKTTLIESFAHGRSVPFDKERIGVTVSAPVKYDAREFVLHLFSSLCERVLGDKRREELAGGRSSRRRTRIRSLAKLLGGMAVALIAIGAAMLLTEKTAPEGPRETGSFLLVVGATLAYVAAAIWVNRESWFTARHSGLRAQTGDHPRDHLPPERVAEERFEQIKFQQSISSAQTGGVALPLGIKFGAESSTTLARVPWSLPEAVGEFRRYAAALAKDRYVVIGIDELDKMESDETAQQFLNNVKGVFGVTGCYYLVSVSQDAMTSFERRGLPFRDVFDSSFDAIQRVGYLTLDESRGVLESRVTGLPVPFQCLCHCMSGGLPRDLIRTTRELVHQQKVHSLVSLGELCIAVVWAEHRGKMVAAMETARASVGDRTEWVVKWLHRQYENPVSAAAMYDRYLELERWGGMAAPSKEGDLRAREIAVEVATFDYYAATVLELFGTGDRFVAFLDPSGSKEIATAAEEVLESLAHARQQFSVSPWLAWESVSAVREMTDWLDPWRDPRPPQPVTAV